MFANKRKYGYLLEVDVDYPKECAKMKVKGVEKLIPNLYNKRKYIVHIRALKQAIDHGLVLKKIHRCI